MGKTGTTDNAVHVWMVGSSTAVATAVWVGNIAGKQSLRQISVNGTQAALLRHRDLQAGRAGDRRVLPGQGLPAARPVDAEGQPRHRARRAWPEHRGGQGRHRARRAELRAGQARPIPTFLQARRVVRAPVVEQLVPRGTEVVVCYSNGQAAPYPMSSGKTSSTQGTTSTVEGWANVVGSCDTKDPPGPPGPDGVRDRSERRDRSSTRTP